jgi:hypothetical protein
VNIGLFSIGGRATYFDLLRPTISLDTPLGHTALQ